MSDTTTGLSARLLNDLLVRRTAQIVIIAIIIAALSLQLSYVVPVIMIQFFNVDSLYFDHFEPTVFVLLRYPYDSSFGSLTSALGYLLPIAVSAVCFTIDKNASPWTATSNLNRFGHICLFILIMGMAVGFLSLVLATLTEDIMRKFIEDDTQFSLDKNAVRGTLSAIVTFYGVYLMRLLGTTK